MAAKVLKGEAEAKDMKYESFKEGDIIVNTAAAKKIGMTISQNILDEAEETYDEISTAE